MRTNITAPRSTLVLVVIGWLLPSLVAAAATPATMRVDVMHGGDAKSQSYALERVLIEPLPWAGNPARAIDTSNRGQCKFEIVDAASGKVLYSRGYSTVFGEWRTFNGGYRSQHLGLDLFAREGSTVKAINAGTVVLVRDCFLAGNASIS